MLGHGGRPASFAAVDDRAGLDAALAAIGAPAILKTRRFGYDGKGQARIDAAGDADQAWEAVGGAPSVLEGFVDFDAEFSILLCRGGDGETAVWDAPVNRHRGGILVRSEIPAGAALAAAVAEGEALARRIADALDYVGMLTLEFFAVGGAALFNELAPRVHNSGHWTIEGALTSQFENHIRAICGLPLGATARIVPRVEMVNLVGDEVGGLARRSSPIRPPISTSTARASPAPAARWATSPGCCAPGLTEGRPLSAGCITSIGMPSRSSCGRTRAASPTTTQTKLSGLMICRAVASSVCAVMPR